MSDDAQRTLNESGTRAGSRAKESSNPEPEERMHQITFTVNGRTLNEFKQLQKEFNVNTRAAVLRRILALARVATTNAGPDHTLTIMDPNGREKQILLSE